MGKDIMSIICGSPGGEKLIRADARAQHHDMERVNSRRYTHRELHCNSVARLPPPERGLSCASLILRARPSKSLPFSACIAREASALDISNEAKAAGTARIAIVDQRELLNGAMGSEQVADGFFGCREGKIADI